LSVADSGSRRSVLRNALIATATVAILVIALCVAVDAVVARSLQASAETRLQQSLGSFQSESAVFPLQEPDLDDPVVGWRVDATGRVTASSPGAPALPAVARTATSPTSVRLDGADFLVAGTALGGGNRIVVGESLASVSRATNTLVIAEVIVAPVLLVLVFGGAMLFGRRVVRPLERAHRLQLEFTADASHELRTPLSVMEAETSLALSQTRRPDADTTTLQRLLGETRRMRGIVEDLLWLARFDSAPRAPRHELVDVAASAEVAAARFEAVAGSRGQRLDVVTAPEGAALIDAPPEWIDRLAGVLLDNACRYTPSGGRVRIAVATAGSHVRLLVEDSGPGIPAAQRSRVFDRFRRLSTDGEGAGLGLAIGDAVVRATKGRWEVGASAEGGASVAVVWPLAGAGLVDGREVEGAARALGDGTHGVVP
jgi:signal transduction histidine kinase